MSVVAKSVLAVGFDELKVSDDPTITIPDRLKDSELTERARKILYHCLSPLQPKL